MCLNHLTILADIMEAYLQAHGCADRAPLAQHQDQMALEMQVGRPGPVHQQHLEYQSLDNPR